MGSREFNIRPDTLARASQQFLNSSDELAQAIQTLQAKVLGTGGSPWGQDELGSLFAETYTAVSGTGLQAMQHLASQLASIAEGLQQMGQNLESADQTNETTFDQFRSKL